MQDYSVRITPTNVKDGEARLQMRVRWADKSAGFNLGVVVSVNKWDDKLQLCKNNTTHGRKKLAASEINKLIRRYISSAQLAFDTFGRKDIPDVESYKRAFNIAIGKESKAVISEPLSKVCTEYITVSSSSRSWSENTVKRWRTIRLSLQSWNPDATLLDMTANGLRSYSDYLTSSGKCNRTVDKYLSNVNQLLRWADRSGKAVATDYATSKERIKVAPKTIVWLTWEEILRLYSLDVENELLSRIKDMFCFSCFTGLRYSDVAGLKHSNVTETAIVVNTIKTNENVYIELNRYAKEILLRHKNADPVSALPTVANATCNKGIKELCRMVGLTNNCSVIDYAGSQRREVIKPKCELVTFHTARRSFVCACLEKGISAEIIMQWTGHASYEEMRPYIAITDKAKASAMHLLDV